MALNSSGAISMRGAAGAGTGIVNEFGGPGNLRAYLRGAGYVPDTSQNAGVPASGSISFSQMHSAAAWVPLSVSGPAATDATRGYTAGGVQASATATVSGGTPGYTLSATKLSGTTMTISYNQASRIFYFAYNWSTNNLGGDRIVTAVYRCYVTDAASSQGYFDCTITLTQLGSA